MSGSRLHRPVLLALAAFSITLIRLPQYFGHNRPLKISALVVLVIGIMALAPQPRRRLNRKMAGFATLYALVIAVEILRGAKLGAYSSVTSGAIEAATYLAVLLYATILVATARSQDERHQRLVALVMAPAIYAAANAVLHLGGAVSPATLDPNSISVAANTPAQLLGLVGIHALRVEFPFTNSVNGFGIVAGASLASMMVLARRAKTRLLRAACLLFSMSALYCLLWGDNRGTLLIAVAVILLFALSHRLRVARGVAILLPLFPLLVTWGLGLVADSSLVGTFSRQGDNLATATNRTYIWEAAWNVLKHPSLNWIYGWGAGGQITSGASHGYAYLFGSLSAARIESTHNVVLQTVVDGGLIALALLAAASYGAIERLSRMADEPACAALLAALLVVLLSGLTEDTPSYYTQEALLTVLIAFGAASAATLLPRPARLPGRRQPAAHQRPRRNARVESLT